MNPSSNNQISTKAGLFLTELFIGLVLIGLFSYDRAFYFNTLEESSFEEVEVTVRGKHFEGGSSASTTPGHTGYWLTLYLDDEDGSPLCRSEAIVTNDLYHSIERGEQIDALMIDQYCYLEEDQRWQPEFRTRLTWYLIAGSLLLLHVLFTIVKFLRNTGFHK